MKTKGTKKAQPQKSKNAANGNSAPKPEVMTLAEAAAYLRVGERDLSKLAEEQKVPARQIGSQWRFLRKALRRWLNSASTFTGNQAFIKFAGSWKDDPYIEEIVRDAYRRRKSTTAESAE